jgi:cytidylate kinase
VVVGRDITSQVLPSAAVKIFLTADLETRITRRYQNYGKKIPREKIKEKLLERDERDQNRSVSPLQKTADSYEINTTDLTPDEVLKKILVLVNAKLYKM